MSDRKPKCCLCFDRESTFNVGPYPMCQQCFDENNLLNYEPYTTKKTAQSKESLKLVAYGVWCIAGILFIYLLTKVIPWV